MAPMVPWFVRAENARDGGQRGLLRLNLRGRIGDVMPKLPVNQPNRRSHSK
jgi:hypothetical protein